MRGPGRPASTRPRRPRPGPARRARSPLRRPRGDRRGRRGRARSWRARCPARSRPARRTADRAHPLLRWRLPGRARRHRPDPRPPPPGRRARPAAPGPAAAGAGAGQPGGQRRQPSPHRRTLAAEQLLFGVPFDQPRRPGRITGLEGVPHRVAGQPVLLAPGRRVVVQRRDLTGLFGPQPGVEQVGEQVVVAPPAADLIQRHQEQPRLLHLLQQRLAAGAAGHRVAQRAGQPLQHRSLQQERAHLLALPLEHLPGQEVQHVAVAAGERRHEPGDIVLPAQRQGRPAAVPPPTFRSVRPEPPRPRRAGRIPLPPAPAAPLPHPG